MTKKTVLFSSLNWGLGHAVRDIPLIKQLLKNNFEVILAGEGESGELLKNEFPSLKFLTIKSFQIKYSRYKLFFILKILIQLPEILYGIKKEYKQLKQILKEYKIDLIISDNRYGIYSNKISSVFITHQISPKLPGYLKIFEKFIFKIHKKKIEKFDLCLIPDFSGKENISGKLSHMPGLSDKYKYIGILSDFQKKEDNTIEKEYDAAVILSGPEPQRTLAEEKIIGQIKNTDFKVVCILGKPHIKLDKTEKNIRYISHLPGKEMQKVILSSDIIVCRSGYTSIMDLITLNKKAILIPTPGQSEQEYLAKYLSDKNCFLIRNQNNLNIKEAFEQLKYTENTCEDFTKYEKEDFIEIVKSII